jgi:hypothetical protein
MRAETSQEAYRASLLDANRAVIDRIRSTVASLSAEEIARRPPNGGWSIGEVLEHLIVSADSYLAVIRARLKESDRRSQPDSMWKPSFIGGLFVQSFRSPRKMWAPRMYKPGPSPRLHVLEEFLRRQEDVGRVIAEAGEVDWRRTRFTSPVTSLVRMNLGDALTVLVAHAERHAKQIDRVRRANAKEPELASR